MIPGLSSLEYRQTEGEARAFVAAMDSRFRHGNAVDLGRMSQDAPESVFRRYVSASRLLRSLRGPAKV